MNQEFSKWVAMWGNAVSISKSRPEGYAKDVTLRYPVSCPFDGSQIRLTFDNYCGTEEIQIEKTVVWLEGVCYPVFFQQERPVKIEAGQNVVSDPLPITVKRGQTMQVAFYLKEFTQMRSSVYVQGPLSGGLYARGDQTSQKEIDCNISEKTNIYYFLSNISIYTYERNHALVCYGDSITAQDWPDDLALLLAKEGIDNLSVIRRATSGSRILREYECITYESYGLKGRKRFEHEVPTDGADLVLIQQGINDIIHPVGVEVNPFRPMSDLPTCQELTAGLDWYLECCRKYGYQVLLGTLLPIEGWRTYAEFRETLKNEFNDVIRNKKEIAGVVDFDKAVRNPERVSSFAEGYDSGDHLHPSAKGYERMAREAFFVLQGLTEGKDS